MEPREVTSPDGTKRWVGADGRSFDSVGEAKAAVATQLKTTDEAVRLRLFHLQGDGSAILSGLPSTQWVLARTAEDAVKICTRALSIPVTKRRNGRIRVYVYEGQDAAIVSLEHRRYFVAEFSDEDVRRIWAE